MTSARVHYMRRSTKILTFLFILSLCINGIQFGWLQQVNKNNDEYTTQIRHNFEQRELGYRIRLDAVSKAAEVLGLRGDSIALAHRDLVRKDSLRIIELARIKGRFDKLTADQVRSKMIEEYNKSK